MNSSLRIIVSGLIAQHFTLGGVAWDYIQYLMGLKNLGHDVWYFEDSGEWPYTLDGGLSGNEWVAPDCHNNIRYLERVLSFAGLENKWAYHFPTKSEWYGLSDSKRKNIKKTADLLINISGSIEQPSHYGEIEQRVYIDSDPGFTQVKMKSNQEEFSKRIRDHTIHFSFGERLPEYLQTEGIQWYPTRTPIVLSSWDHLNTAGDAYTTIMNWTSYPPLQFEGKKYGQKDIEFVRFLELPLLKKDLSFEIALSKTQHKNWQSDINHPVQGLAFKSPNDMLDNFGWKVIDPQRKCFDMFSYRDYIQNSKAEWSVAKAGYVISKPGWFSCRSACYLAAGKPVIVQDTGFEGIIPTGKGVHSFNTIHETIHALDKVESDYLSESLAAREIAEEYFRTEKVLSDLIDTTYSRSKKSVLYH